MLHDIRPETSLFQFDGLFHLLIYVLFFNEATENYKQLVSLHQSVCQLIHQIHHLTRRERVLRNNLKQLVVDYSTLPSSLDRHHLQQQFCYLEY